MRSCRSRVLACVLPLGIVLAGCGGPQDRSGEAEAEARASSTPGGHSGPPERGDWLVLWLLADPEKLNPLTSNDSASNSVLGWMFSGLLTTDNETLELRPLIAAAMPEISEDKLTYTFRLRDDVTFSDGVPLTAHDVVFTMKAIKIPRVDAAPSRNYYESVRDVVAVDDHTVRFDLRQLYFRNTLVLGDVVVGIDGEGVGTREELDRILLEKSVGDEVVLDLVREGTVHAVSVVLDVGG